jgi:hypothetical protein
MMKMTITYFVFAATATVAVVLPFAFYVCLFFFQEFVLTLVSRRSRAKVGVDFVGLGIFLQSVI